MCKFVFLLGYVKTPSVTVFVYPTLKALVPSVKLCDGDSVGALCID